MKFNPLAHPLKSLVQFLAFSANAGASARSGAADSLVPSLPPHLRPFDAEPGVAQAALARPRGHRKLLANARNPGQCVATFEKNDSKLTYACAFDKAQQPASSAPVFECDALVAACNQANGRSAAGLDTLDNALAAAAARNPNSVAAALTTAMSPTLADYLVGSKSLAALLGPGSMADDARIRSLAFALYVRMPTSLQDNMSKAAASFKRLDANALRFALSQTSKGNTYVIYADLAGVGDGKSASVTLRPQGPRDSNDRMITAVVNGGVNDGVRDPFFYAVAQMAFTWDDPSVTIGNLINFDRDLGSLREIAGRSPELAANKLLEHIVDVQARYPGSSVLPAELRPLSASDSVQKGFLDDRIRAAAIFTAPAVGSDGGRSVDTFNGQVQQRMVSQGYSQADQNTVMDNVRMFQLIGRRLISG